MVAPVIRASGAPSSRPQPASASAASRSVSGAMRCSRAATGSAAEIVEHDVLALDPEVLQHLDHGRVHHGRPAQVVLAVLGGRMVLQVLLVEHLVDEAGGAFPLVLG